MQKKYILSGLAALVLSFNVLAMSLSEAKNQGLVGEQANGYVGVVVASAKVQTLVESVNAKRKAKYQQLATKNNITLAQVEKLAAQKAYQKTAAGQYIQQNGNWVKK